jgi:putative redox protein
MDIVAILHKANKPVSYFNMKVTGTISKKPPVEYTDIHLVYEFEGPDENREAAMNAVTDSQEKYCGVSHMLKKALPVTWEVQYNHQTIFNNHTEPSTVLN